MSQDQLLTLQQAADRLQISMSTIRRLIKAGKLQAVQIGRNLRIRPADLEAYINEGVKKHD